MLRAIGAVILGYLVMFVIVFVSFTIAYALLKADGSFKPGTYEVSTVWIAVTTALGLIAAIAGGWLCALIARGGKAPIALAIVVLVLGGLASISAFQPPDEDAPTERTAEVGNWEAMMYARTPPIAALLNPVVGVVGIMIGARLKGGGAAPADG
jgi:hypothetical protein